MKSDSPLKSIRAFRWNSPRVFAIALAAVFVLTVFAVVGGSVPVCALILFKSVDVVIAFAWLAAAAGIGAALLKLSRMDRGLGLPLKWVTSAAMGLGVISLATLGFGLVGWMNGIVAWGILILGLGCLVGSLAAARLSSPKSEAASPAENRKFDSSRTGFIRWLWVLPAAALAIAFVGSLVPPGLLWGDEPNGYDVVEYHLQVPREWYELGRITPLAHNVFSYFPFNVEMHYLLGMQLRGGPWAGMYLAQLMHVGLIALTVAAVYALLAERSRWMATVAAVAVATTPWTGLLAPVAYNEGGLLLWGTLACGLALRGRSHWPSMLLAGAMAGFACGSKLTAVPMVLLAVPLVCVVIERFRRKAVMAAIAFIIAGSVTFSPWLVRNLAWIGNPVFPEATAIFGRGHWSDTQVERWKRANHLPRLDQQNLGGRLAAGWDQVLGDWRYGFAILPLGLFAGALAWRRQEARGLMLLLGILCVFWLFFTHLQSRFFTLSIPMTALLIGQIGGRPWERWTAAIIIALAGVVGIGAIYSKLTRINPHLLETIGLEKLRGFTPLAEVDVPPDARVVLVGEGRAFWYDVPMARLSYRTVFDVDALAGEVSVAAWKKGLPAGTGPTFDVLSPSELLRFSRTYWGIPAPPSEVMRMPPETVVIRETGR